MLVNQASTSRRAGKHDKLIFRLLSAQKAIELLVDAIGMPRSALCCVRAPRTDTTALAKVRLTGACKDVGNYEGLVMQQLTTQG